MADARVVADAPLPAQSGEHPEETIRFGLECLYLDSWAHQRTYQAFREVLGSGICHHLQVGAGSLIRGTGTALAGADGLSSRRITSCYGRSSALGLPWCWTQLL